MRGTFGRDSGRLSCTLEGYGGSKGEGKNKGKKREEKFGTWGADTGASFIYLYRAPPRPRSREFVCDCPPDFIITWPRCVFAGETWFVP